MGTEATELHHLRQRVAKLERMVLGRDAVLTRAFGTALGRNRKEIDKQIGAIEERAPVSLGRPLTDPAVHFCGLWDARRMYVPGAMVTCSGAGWIAMSAMAAGVRPGDGQTAWRLAVKSDASQLKRTVQDEVRKQLGVRK